MRPADRYAHSSDSPDMGEDWNSRRRPSFHGLSRTASSPYDFATKRCSLDASPGPRGSSFDLYADVAAEPLGGQPVSPPLRSTFLAPLRVDRPLPGDEDKAFLRGRLPAIVPVQTYIAAFAELPQGARTTLRTCLSSWREGKMPEDQVREFLRSVAWQSPSLNEWANAVAGAAGPAASDQLLDLDDLAALLGSACGEFSAPVLEAARLPAAAAAGGGGPAGGGRGPRSPAPGGAGSLRAPSGPPRPRGPPSSARPLRRSGARR